SPSIPARSPARPYRASSATCVPSISARSTPGSSIRARWRTSRPHRNSMRRLARLVITAVVVIAPAVASAQPSEPTEASGSDTAESKTGVGGAQGSAAVDEAHVKELVDKELAKILNDRAARDAAERAAREDQSQTSTSSSPPNLTGSSGFMDTRIA